MQGPRIAAPVLAVLVLLSMSGCEPREYSWRDLAKTPGRVHIALGGDPACLELGLEGASPVSIARQKVQQAELCDYPLEKQPHYPKLTKAYFAYGQLFYAHLLFAPGEPLRPELIKQITDVSLHQPMLVGEPTRQILWRELPDRSTLHGLHEIDLIELGGEGEERQIMAGLQFRPEQDRLLPQKAARFHELYGYRPIVTPGLVLPSSLLPTGAPDTTTLASIHHDGLVLENRAMTRQEVSLKEIAARSKSGSPLLDEAFATALSREMTRRQEQGEALGKRPGSSFVLRATRASPMVLPLAIGRQVTSSNTHLRTLYFLHREGRIDQYSWSKTAGALTLLAGDLRPVDDALHIALSSAGVRLFTNKPTPRTAIAPIEGCPKDGPTLCVKTSPARVREFIDRARELDAQMTDVHSEQFAKANAVYEELFGAYRWNELRARLDELNEGPGKATFVYHVEGDVPLALFVKLQEHSMLRTASPKGGAMTRAKNTYLSLQPLDAK